MDREQSYGQLRDELVDMRNISIKASGYLIALCMLVEKFAEVAEIDMKGTIISAKGLADKEVGRISISEIISNARSIAQEMNCKK